MVVGAPLEQDLSVVLPVSNFNGVNLELAIDGQCCKSQRSSAYRS